MRLAKRFTNCSRKNKGEHGAGSTIPYQDTPITYDLSVRANGCYKAESPPLLVGPQTFKDARHENVVNPLFTIYGCFDPV